MSEHVPDPARVGPGVHYRRPLFKDWKMIPLTAACFYGFFWFWLNRIFKIMSVNGDGVWWRSDNLWHRLRIALADQDHPASTIVCLSSVWRGCASIHQWPPPRMSILHRHEFQIQTWRLSSPQAASPPKLLEIYAFFCHDCFCLPWLFAFFSPGMFWRVAAFISSQAYTVLRYLCFCCQVNWMTKRRRLVFNVCPHPGICRFPAIHLPNFSSSLAPRQSLEGFFRMPSSSFLRFY